MDERSAERGALAPAADDGATGDRRVASDRVEVLAR
jgi:hypothetical protein